MLDGENDSSTLVGWIAVFIACISFGSFAVPMKAESVIKVQVHPLVFQTYKTFWVFVTCWITAIWVPVEFTPWGIISGLSWVPAGVAAVISVQHVGLGVGQGTWSSIIVLVSFCWGVLFFKEKLQSVGVAIFGIICLMFGVGGMAYYSAQASSESNDKNEDKYIELNAEKNSDDETTSILIKNNKNNDNNTNNKEVHHITTSSTTSKRQYFNFYKYFSRRQIGMLAAVFNGIWGGSNMVPLRIVHGSSNNESPNKSGGGNNKIPSGVGFVISFAIGSAIVNILMWFILYFWRKRITRKPLPSLHLKVMFIPGMIAGCFWALGNLMAMVAVLSLGEAVGYSCVQASILVSGLWSIFYYHEVKQPKHIALWLGSALFALVGIIILSIMQQT